MQKLIYKNIFWAIITMFVFMLVFSLLFENTEKAETLSINQIVSKINSGEITKITVRGDDLSIDLKDDKKAIAKKEAEAGLSQTLKNYGIESSILDNVDIEIKDRSGFKFWMGIIIPTLLPLIIIIAIFLFILKQAKGGVNQALSFGKSNLKLFNSLKNRVTFKDVAGLKEAKQELVEIVDFLKNPKKYLAIGAKIPRGVLLMGSPGTGKTLLARAVAGESGVPFFYISASEFVEMFVGVGASRIRNIFDTAKKSAPSILFIDEIDAVGRERGTGIGGGHDEREQTLNQILVEMDGFEKEARIIVIAATNRPDVLDRALLRPGRFDRQVVLDLPDINDREAILQIHGADKIIEKNVNLRKVAVRTPGFSGADLANLMNEAAILAARNNRKTISQDDLFESVEKVLLGPERRGRVISLKEKEITAYHEAGHALVTASIKGSDPVHKISIISRGRAGGYTMKLPIEETHLKTKSQFLSDLATLMGGYAAEKSIFGEVSTGASNDLREATKLARALVTQFGMSEKLGPMTFGESQELVFLGREISTTKNYSEEVAVEIDKEVRSLINRAYKASQRILKLHQKILEKIAKTLIEKETLEQEDFYKLLKDYKIKPIEV
ncbi:ATP-dependent zinc metalloprotease FtsH [Patescibacteria group bacterium]|nr:ATP-dependent zinc metalloprotease FtsH [Patescibacteria group bacterium]